MIEPNLSVCFGRLKLEVVWSTNYGSYYASNHKSSFWPEDADDNIGLMTDQGVGGEGFKLKVDNCKRLIVGGSDQYITREQNRGDAQLEREMFKFWILDGELPLGFLDGVLVGGRVGGHH